MRRDWCHRVTDAANGQPVAGANGQIVGTASTATTGPDGRYAIVSAPVGSEPASST